MIKLKEKTNLTQKHYIIIFDGSVNVTQKNNFFILKFCYWNI